MVNAHANTLFITTQGAYLSRDHAALHVKIEGKVRLKVPVHHLEGIVCFGRVMVSPAVYAFCAERRLTLAFLTEQGRFLARVQPPITGNVLLRREQYRVADQPDRCLAMARPIVAAKIQNSRLLALRSARELGEGAHGESLRQTAQHLGALLTQVAPVGTLDELRGLEGAAARRYFETFSAMIRVQDAEFAFDGRTRRPPRDPINAMLSFLYALVRHDCSSALEAVGLDPAVGYLHADRPGRPSLALDLMEEFRSLLADRLVLRLINRRQVRPTGFRRDPAGSVSLDDDARRTILVAYQERKREEVQHPLLGETVRIGLLYHVQARLLARTLRGDLVEYPAIVLR